MSALLEVNGLVCSLGGVRALDGVDLAVQEGSVVGIVGPNGAGKTTLFNAISGFVAPTAGEVRWEGRSITGLAPHRVARLGLVRTFQNASGFESLTIDENLRLAGADADNGLVTELQRSLGLTPGDRQIKACGLATRKLVGVALALLRNPRMVLLDEPLAGLDIRDRAAVVEVIRGVVDRGVTVCLIEHDVERTLALADHLLILDAGRKLAEGSPDDLNGRPELANVYLRMD